MTRIANSGPMRGAINDDAPASQSTAPPTPSAPTAPPTHPALGPVAPSAPPPAARPATGGAPTLPRIEVVRRLLRSGQFDAAVEVARAALQAAPKDPRAHFYLGLSLHKSKRYAQALEHLSLAAAAADSAFPEAAHAVHYLAWCRYYLGDLAGAREAFIEHINAFPNYDDSHFGLGLVALDEDKVAEAEQCFRTALALLAQQQGAPRERAKNLARLGDVLLRQERLVEAETAYRRAVEMWQDHYEAWAKLARVLDRLDRPQEAEAARRTHSAIMARLGREEPK